MLPSLQVWLPVTEDRWQQLRNAAADYPVQQKLRDIIRIGWPENRALAPECVCPYFDVRDELTIQNELVFKGQQIVVPAVLRKELMEKTRHTLALKDAYAEQETPCTGHV